MNKASLLTAFAILFIDYFGFAIIGAALSSIVLHGPFLSDGLAMAEKNLLLGFALAVFPLAQFFGAPFIGDIGDKYGRKTAFFFTIVGQMAGYLVSAFSINMHAFSLFVLSRAFTGLCTGNLTLSLSTISDLSSTTKQKGRNFGIVAVLIGISLSSSAMIGLTLVNSPFFKEEFANAAPFYLISVLNLISLLLLSFFFQECHLQEARCTAGDKAKKIQIFKSVHDILLTLKSKSLGIIYLFLVLWFSGFYLAMQWNTATANEIYNARYEDVIKALILFAILWTASGMLLPNFLTTKFSGKAITFWSLVIVMSMYCFAALSTQYIIYSIFFALAGLAAAIGWTSSMRLISDRALPEEQGKALGIGQSMMAFSQFLGPIIGTGLATISIHLIYFGSSFLILLALLILLFVLFGKRTA